MPNTKLGKTVILISNFDWAGSGYRISEAVNLTTNNNVEYVVLYPVEYPINLKRYPSILKTNSNGEHVMMHQDVSRLIAIINEADILLFKGDYPPKPDFIPGINIDFSQKKTISYPCGSNFRRGHSPTAHPMSEFDEYDKCDIKIVGSPDLNYPEFGAKTWAQIPYPTHKYENSYKKSEIPLISHSPSTRNKKGTKLLIKAHKKLKGRFTLDIIENVSYGECLKRKQASTIFFDQINDVGWYGNSAVEAMAMGIPVITNISDQALNQADGKILHDFPVWGSGDTLDELCESIEHLLEQDLAELSEKTYSWCHNFHGYEAVGKMWDEIYKEL